MFIAVLFIIAKICKPLKCPLMNEWIRKMYTYTVEYYSSLTQKEILPFAITRASLEDIMLREISQTQKDNSVEMFSFTCVI